MSDEPPSASTPDRPRGRRFILAGSVALGVLVFAASFWSARRSTRHLEALGDFHAPAVAAVEDMRGRMAEAIEEAFAYLVLDNPIERDEFLSWAAGFEDQLSAFRSLEASARDDEAGLVVDALAQEQVDLVAAAQRMFNEFEVDGRASADTVLAFELTVDDLLTTTEELLLLERTELAAAHASALASIRGARASALWVGTATLVLSLVLGVLLARLTANELRATLVHQTRLTTIGQISASIAHELRNPLGAIRNAAYFVRRHHPPQDKLDEYNDLIQREVDVATNIIRNLTEMARARQPVRRSVDLEQSLRDCAQRFISTPEIEVEIDVHPQPFELEVDPTQLEQVVGNLLSNASQAMQGAGRVRIRATRTEREALIEIEDDGPGMTAQARARLFEPLFSTKAKGTGLGLTISRQIVELHKGTLELSRTGPEGSTFSIRFPRIAPSGGRTVA